jgi:hypothetical protein
MECRYAPKYASQYKSKHTKHVKLSKKIRFPLDAQKEYPDREWPQVFWALICNEKNHLGIISTCISIMHTINKDVDCVNLPMGKALDLPPSTWCFWVHGHVHLHITKSYGQISKVYVKSIEEAT